LPVPGGPENSAETPSPRPTFGALADARHQLDERRELIFGQHDVVPRLRAHDARGEPGEPVVEDRAQALRDVLGVDVGGAALSHREPAGGVDQCRSERIHRRERRGCIESG
jgi:hypothetical protein